MDTEKYTRVLCRLQALCSRQECCSADMRAKALKAMEGDCDAADSIVESLVNDRFVDDSRYASAFAREKSSLSGWGRQKILFMLIRKGIDRNTAEAALGDVDDTSAMRRLDSVASAKFRALSSDPQCRPKLLRFLLSRGYTYDEAYSAVDRVLNNDSTDF